jgi:excinuclease ABC subunit C
MNSTDETRGTDSADAKPHVEAAAEQPRRSGTEVIQHYLKLLPNSPGVYRMIDAAGDVIYVGKARSLKARVSNYARLQGHPNRIARMIAATVSMEFVTVGTEAQALLLEANLIKRFRPRFNVLMRDDKSFPYIVIGRDHAAPQIAKHRGARTRKGDYFGPFASAGAVNRTVNMLQRAFLLRSCSDSVYESRTRPCLLFQIKRCAAPCTGEISTEDYGRLVDESVRFLRGESQNVRQMYQRMMEEAAEKLEFEQAAKFRNRLWALAHVTADQSINPEGIEEADVFAAHQDNGQTCIQVFFFRTGQNWGNRAYFPRADRSFEVGDILDSFIAQFYDDKPVPRLILLSHEIPSRALLAEALSIKTERKVEISVPRRGTKIGLIEHAQQNAREALGRKLAESSSQKLLLEGVAERFGLAAPPRRIEVYDNSHIMGSNAVGGMIVAGAQGLAKNQYRKFNIKSEGLAPGDDYAMMREVLTRRFKRVAAELRGEVVDSANIQTAMVGGVSINAIEHDQAILRDGMPAKGGAETSVTSAALGQPHAPTLSSFPPSPLKGEGRGGGGLLGPCDEAIEEPHPVTTDGGSASTRIKPPAPPTGARGADAIAFDVLRADPVEPAADDEDEDDETLADSEEMPTIPDLVLIDGGAGQLSVARQVLAELGLSDKIPLVGVAKGPDRDAGREHFHVPGRAKSFMLEPRDPVLYFIQRLRDEAHRFAIGTHKAKRAKAMGVNPLDEIGGIGPTRKRALLNHFGSAKAVSRAGIEDLKVVPGISAQMAESIHDFFNEKKG